MDRRGRSDGAELAASVALVTSAIIALCVVLAMPLLGYSTVTRLLVVVATAPASSGLWYLAARSRWRGRLPVGIVSVLYAAVFFGVPVLTLVLFPA